MPVYVAPAPPQERQLVAEPGVLVTSARVVVGQQTYPVAGISSVAPFTQRAHNPPNGVGIGMMIVGALLVLGGIGQDFTGGAVLTVIFGAALVGGAALVFKFSPRKPDVHGVVITSAGAQFRALETTDLHQVSRVVGAINHALSMR
jgi:hypothetical protein